MGGKFRVENTQDEVLIFDMRAETRPSVCVSATCDNSRDSCLKALNWLADHGEVDVQEYEIALTGLPDGQPH